ncbi:MAG: class I SAM-dependent RNA methyltransferase [Pseudomonadota bacterium]
MADLFDMFLVVQPGLESTLADEAADLGFTVTGQAVGGVTIRGDWTTVWQANLTLRGATRVLVRLAEFRALHLAQLDKRARRLAWGDWFHPGTAVEVDATCRKSRIYHHRAAAERVQTAITDALGPPADDEALSVKLRIEDDLAVISLDTSGEALHRRGHKLKVNKAPMRETLAAMFLRACGYRGAEPVYDPMCGSGTFVLEAAEIAAGLAPGRARPFAFEALASFDPQSFGRMKHRLTPVPQHRFYGSDRDQGAIAMSRETADRAGVSHLTEFHLAPISDAAPPCETPGLVIANPPYGARIGNKKPLYGLYAAFGEVMKERFQGWRVAIVTSDGGLAKATSLPFLPPGSPIDHGGIKVRLYQTDPL